MPNQHGRYIPANLPHIVTSLGIPSSGNGLARALRKTGRKSPKDSHVIRIFTHGVLMKKPMADSLIDGLKSFAQQQDINTNEVDWNLLAFDHSVEGLGSILASEGSKSVNATRNLIEEISAASGLPAVVIRAASSGNCTDLPYKEANKIAMAAQSVLQIANALEVTPYMSRKPIGGTRVENGAKAYQCPETRQIRMSLLSWAA